MGSLLTSRGWHENPGCLDWEEEMPKLGEEGREVGTWPGQTCSFKILWATSFSIIKAFKLILLSSMGIWIFIFAWNLCYVMCHIYLNILGKGI